MSSVQTEVSGPQGGPPPVAALELQAPETSPEADQPNKKSKRRRRRRK